MKEPKCKACGETGHYKTFCRKTARKPIAARKPLQRTAIARKATSFKDTTPKPLKRSAIKKTPVSERKKLIIELDRAFSTYTRKRYAAPDGFVSCYTCTKRDHWRSMDCAHYIPRGVLALRFDERNVRVCCKTCNQLLDGNMAMYRINMIAEVGIVAVEELEGLKHTTVKYTQADLRDMIELYNRKSNILQL